MQYDYFIPVRSGGQEHPLLSWAQPSGMFLKGKAVSLSAPIQLKLSTSFSRRLEPVMVDYHGLPEPVVSKRVRDVLEPLDLYAVQLLPAEVELPKGQVLQYWLIHVYNEIACLDRQRSLCTYYDYGDVSGIEQLVLDVKVLRGIPQEERLVFYLSEAPSVLLFHHAVVEKVLAVHPVGLRFVRVDAWNDSIAFQP